MALINYKLIYLGDEGFLTVVSPDGEPLVATTSSHKNFEELVAAVEANDPKAFDLFEAGKAIVRKFKDLANGRLAVRNGQVYYDDDPLDLSISDTILAFYEADEDFSPLARYVENVMANPQVESREQFYRWIEGDDHHFPLSEDGCIVAYKGVKALPNGGGYTSISHGRAFVNNVEHNGAIPNAVGDVVTMPRSEVEFNPDVHCHVGLHAGTWKYASGFAQGAVMLVKINPRDVVSVPRDHNSEKVRVCRYEVVGFAKTQNEALVYVDEHTVLDVKDVPEVKDDVQDVPEVKAKPVKAAPKAKVLAPKSNVHHVGDVVTLKQGRHKRLLSTEVGTQVTVSVSEGHYLNEGAFLGTNGVAYWDDEAEPAAKRLPRRAAKPAVPAKVAGVFDEGDAVVLKVGAHGNRSLLFDGGKTGERIGDLAGKRGTIRGKHESDRAVIVYVGGQKLSLWKDEVEHDPKGHARKAVAGKVDTRLNHTKQKRDSRGHFIKG